MSLEPRDSPVMIVAYKGLFCMLRTLHMYRRCHLLALLLVCRGLHTFVDHTAPRLCALSNQLHVNPSDPMSAGPAQAMSISCLARSISCFASSLRACLLPIGAKLTSACVRFWMPES